ncbi:MAG: hypothetical protein JWO03_1467 [Bacteroidetes bacterium]|nr:hypothetical protein [Bacteroidota bacterium]
MKQTIWIFALIAICATSCTKTATSTNSFGNFSYGGTSYTATLGSEGTGFGNASYDILGSADVPAGGTDHPTISVNFASKPIANMTYSVMDGSGTPGSTRCFVIYTASSGVRYLSTNGTGQTVTVTVSGSTVTAVGNGITLEEDNNSSNSGSTTFNFHN